MMKRKKISRFLAIGICGAVLAGCSSNEDNTADTSATESEITQSVDTTNSESSSATSETSSSSESEEASDSEEIPVSSSDQENKESADLSSELKMNPDTVLLPTDFPTADSSSVTGDILTNEADNYMINYTDDQGELAEISGTLYESSDLAKEEMDTFSNGKTVGSLEEGGEELGYGITGYMSAGLGSTHFSWEEGNWLFSITSVAEDKMDVPGIAKKMVDYLEEHSLPAPEDMGVVFIQYPQGGEDVNVDIRWQDEDKIYQLKTTKVPLDALEMAVSME